MSEAGGEGGGKGISKSKLNKKTKRFKRAIKTIKLTTELSTSQLTFRSEDRSSLDVYNPGSLAPFQMPYQSFPYSLSKGNLIFSFFIESVTTHDVYKTMQTVKTYLDFVLKNVKKDKIERN